MLWRLKIFAKLILSRLPISYSSWSSLGLFRHGDMDNPQYAISVFDKHFKHHLNAGTQTNEATFLELGPGDTLFTALIAHSYNVKKMILLDAGHFATNDLAPYMVMAQHLHESGLKSPDMSNLSNLGSLLDTCGSLYMTGGLNSLRAIPDKSIDFIFSQAVLEHVLLEEFSDYIFELSRVLKPSGVMSHRIDFKDHIGGGLNNLRFRVDLWESRWFAKKSGFYTNRLRYSEILAVFEKAGFSSLAIKTDRWSQPPLVDDDLAMELRGKYSSDDLSIAGVDLVSRLTA